MDRRKLMGLFGLLLLAATLFLLFTMVQSCQRGAETRLGGDAPDTTAAVVIDPDRGSPTG